MKFCVDFYWPKPLHLLVRLFLRFAWRFVDANVRIVPERLRSEGDLLKDWGWRMWPSRPIIFLHEWLLSPSSWVYRQKTVQVIHSIDDQTDDA